MQKLAGIGLRPTHYSDILSGKARIEWFEAISENFMDTGGRPLQVLEKVRENYPVALHGVSLNIGSPDPVNKKYLKSLQKLIERIQPWNVTDHLCWGGVGGKNWHDLLPLPMTEESVRHVSRKVQQVQDFLGRQIALENISTYLRFSSDTLDEADFTRAILEEADCLLMLDVNNAYVNSINHGMNAYDFISRMPSERISQFHLAGHSDLKTFLFDTHDAEVIDPVWVLFGHTIRLHGARPLIIERDDKIPPLSDVEAEAFHAKEIIQEVSHEKSRQAAQI